MDRTGLDVLREALATFGENRDQDLTIWSEVPDNCKHRVCYVGIDEAGRGPVLGPMVYAIFAAVETPGREQPKGDECPPLLIDSIKKLNDSKQLTEQTREELFHVFSHLEWIAFGLKIISPTQISSQSFKRQKVSLNDVSHNAAMELIQGFLDKGINMGRIYVDTVGPMDKYQKKLELKFPELKFKVDKQADSKYKPVSAASVCAKVTRDEILKNWTFPENLKVQVPEDGWGSGYPGDPVTKRFLRKNIDPVFGFPNIVRESWGTASELLKERAVKVKWEADEEDEAAVGGTQKIWKFFGKDAKTGAPVMIKPKRKRKRATFFAHRNLKPTKLF